MTTPTEKAFSVLSGTCIECKEPAPKHSLNCSKRLINKLKNTGVPAHMLYLLRNE